VNEKKVSKRTGKLSWLLNFLRASESTPSSKYPDQFRHPM
jgi:hypothetical protein